MTHFLLSALVLSSFPWLFKLESNKFIEKGPVTVDSYEAFLASIPRDSVSTYLPDSLTWYSHYDFSIGNGFTNDIEKRLLPIIGVNTEKAQRYFVWKSQLMFDQNKYKVSYRLPSKKELSELNELNKKNIQFSTTEPLPIKIKGCLSPEFGLNELTNENDIYKGKQDVATFRGVAVISKR